MTGAAGTTGTAGATPDVVRRAWLRLGGASFALTLLGLTTLLLVPFSRAGVAESIEPFGAAAPIAYVVVGALLGMAFVPGPLLAAASGALFGTGTGFLVTTGSATLSAVLTILLARRTVTGSVDAVSGERATALIELARRRGFLVVVLQRWIPGIPDAPMSYVFGAIGVTVPAVALGTVVGSAPRAFAYSALGDAAVTDDGSLALVAVAVAVGISAVGLVAGAIVVRRHRRSRRDRAESTAETAPD